MERFYCYRKYYDDESVVIIGATCYKNARKITTKLGMDVNEHNDSGSHMWSSPCFDEANLTMDEVMEMIDDGDISGSYVIHKMDGTEINGK